MDYQLRSTGQEGVEVIAQGQIIASLHFFLYYALDNLISQGIEILGRRILLSFQGGSFLEADVQDLQELLVLKLTWHFAKEGNYRLLYTIGYDDHAKENQVFIPALWYKDNEAGEGMFPSFRQSSNWSFLETRMSIPCGIQLSNGQWCLNCCASPAKEKSGLASMTWDRHGTTVCIPGCEWPYSYRGKKELKSMDSQCKPTKHQEANSTYTRSLYILSEKQNDSLKSYEHFLRSMESQFDHPKVRLSWDDYGLYKLTHLLSLIRKDPKGNAYLVMGEGNGEVQEVYEFTAGSFLVKAVEAAYAFARCPFLDNGFKPLIKERERISTLFSLPNDDKLLAKLASLMGRYYLQGEKRPGVFQDCIDLKTGICGGYLGISEHPEFKELVNSRCNGEAMKSYVLLYQALRKQGMIEDAFLELPQRVARFYCDCQLSNGSFGRWWTLGGRPTDTKGTNGAYIGSFFCYLLPLLDSDSVLYADVRSALYRALPFYGNQIEEGQFYGDTLDADSCDKEAAIALLSFFLDAYSLENDERLLDLAIKAARFILTWIWQMNSYLSEDSPLGKYHFCTSGMTSVSIAHHHLDFYGMAIAVDFLRLSQFSHDPYYRRTAYKMMDACRQLIATEEDPLGRGPSFIGWQPEQVNHTTWEYFDRESLMNGHFAIDIAWVNVLGFDAYLTLREQGALPCNE